jgi:hypothetical protein
MDSHLHPSTIAPRWMDTLEPVVTTAAHFDSHRNGHRTRRASPGNGSSAFDQVGE